MADVPQIQYLNTDLDLVAPISLTPLISHFESAEVRPLAPTLGDDGNWYVTFETVEPFDEPDRNIVAMLCAIESASGEARTCWDSCTKREFNVGYDCGDEPWSFNQGLSNETLRRMADCGATFRITLYPFREGTAVQAKPETNA
jgi:hypothetical protein